MGRLNKAAGTETTLQTKTSGAAFLAQQLGGGPALRGEATHGRAVVGMAGSDGTGVYGESPDHFGVRGQSNIGVGVFGQAPGGYGVWGASDSGFALYGTSISSNGLYASSDSGSAIFATSSSGNGIVATSGKGYAAFLDGRVRIGGYVDVRRISDPPAPTGTAARLFTRDNGAGKSELCVRFATGAVQVIKTEP